MPECIARSCRFCRCCCFFVCCNELRLNIACTFSRGEVQIMPLFYLWIKGNVMIRKFNRLDFFGQFSFRIPASDRVRGIQGDFHIGNCNSFSTCAFLRGAYSSLAIQEEHIVNLLEYWIQIYIPGFVNRWIQCFEITRIITFKSR